MPLWKVVNMLSPSIHNISNRSYTGKAINTVNMRLSTTHQCEHDLILSEAANV
jgi:hypothetical protein